MVGGVSGVWRGWVGAEGFGYRWVEARRTEVLIKREEVQREREMKGTGVKEDLASDFLHSVLLSPNFLTT